MTAQPAVQRTPVGTFDLVRRVYAARPALVFLDADQRVVWIDAGLGRHYHAIERELRRSVVSASVNGRAVLAAAGSDNLFEARIDGVGRRFPASVPGGDDAVLADLSGLLEQP